MKRIEWPLLTAEDIEVRIATCKEGKTALLLFQNSRTAMNAFDSMFGEFGWQCQYYDAGGQIYCRIGVYDEERGEWCWKSDTGSESNIEAEKGFSSDCFKRVAVRWGYARELYSAPRIIINNDNKFNTYRCSSIGYDEKRRINQLAIVDRNGNLVFNWKAGQTVQTYQPNIQFEQPKPQQNVYTKQEQKQQVGENDMIPKWLYGKAANAETMETLKEIWNENINYQQNKNFQNIVKKRKNELAIAV